MELIDKAEVLANIDKIQDTYISKLEGRGMSHEDAVLFSAAYINGVKDAVEALEVKAKIEESEPAHFATSEQNEDIEQYARNEADKFASKEYEYYNDIGLLKKGFYWGCKAGANWQEQQMINKGAEWLRDCLDNGLWVDQFLSEKEKEAVVLTYKENMEEEIKLWKK